MVLVEVSTTKKTFDRIDEVFCRVIRCRRKAEDMFVQTDKLRHYLAVAIFQQMNVHIITLFGLLKIINNYLFYNLVFDEELMTGFLNSYECILYKTHSGLKGIVTS